MNPQKNKKIENIKIRGVRINKTVALLVLFCLCIGGISLVSARYIKQTDTNNNSVAAKEFYFESDLLDGGTHEVVATDNGTASVTIRLKNYVDELRYSETQIDYSVEVQEADNDSKLEKSNITNQTGNIATGEKHTQDVTISNLQAGKTYKVTATTNNIYQKTLSGTIKVTAPDTKVYAEISSNTDQYIEVTVWTTDYTGNIAMTYDNKTLLPDNTDEKMKDVLSENNTFYSENWGANTSHVFRFFKTTNAAGKTYQVTVNNDNDSKEVTVSEK